MTAGSKARAWQLILFVVLLAAGGGAPVGAQLAGLTGGDGSESPIEILADDGIEWQQEESLVRARGNARAIRGDIELRADALTAFYRETADGRNEIWRLQADGDVVIKTPTDTAYAAQAIYDVDNAVLVLKRGQGAAGRVRLVGEDGEITADTQMEYWETRQMVVARGNAVANQGDKTLGADVLVAFLESGDGDGAKKGAVRGRGSQIQRVEAFDDVWITTPREHIMADRGIYRTGEGTASLTGEVKITRGPNQLNGCRADVNIDKGTSTLFGCAEREGGASQVRGLIQPEKGRVDGNRN